MKGIFLIFNYAALPIVALLLCPFGIYAEVRTWRNNSNIEIQADLLSVDSLAGTVRIKRTDGMEFTIPLENLCAADRIYASKASVGRNLLGSNYLPVKLKKT